MSELDIKRLVGKNSFTAKNFTVNQFIDTSNVDARRAGIGPLGCHMQLNIALEEVFGMPAWKSWVLNVSSALGTLYSGGQFPIYDTKCLAYYLKYCFYCTLALAEWRRDIKMLKWQVQLDTNAMYDFWGAYANYIQGPDSRIMSQYSAYIDEWNAMSREFYTHYPFREIPFLKVVEQLVSSVWRDDADGRTNYIYFHIFDNYYNQLDTQGLDQPFERARRRLKAWLTEANYGFQKIVANVDGRSYSSEQVVAKITGDLRRVFDDADHTVPELTVSEGIDVVYSRELIDALNQSPLGMPEIIAYESVTGAGYNGRLAYDVSGGYINAVQLFTSEGKFDPTFDATQWDMSYDEGPSITTVMGGSWSSAFSNDKANLYTRACIALQSRSLPITVYHAFKDGAQILTEFSFTAIPEIGTMHGTTPDEEPDFTGSSGTVSMQIHGLFGFCVSRVWAYNATWKSTSTTDTGFKWAVPFSILALGSAVPASVPKFITYSKNFGNGMQDYMDGLEMSRVLANSIDAITTYQWQLYNQNTIALISDEDIDEWAPTTLGTLITNYGSSANGMFIDSYVVSRRSRYIADASEPRGRIGIKTQNVKGGYNGQAEERS